MNPIGFNIQEIALAWMNLGVGVALRGDDARNAPQNRGVKPLLHFAFWSSGFRQEIFIDGDSGNPGFISPP